MTKEELQIKLDFIIDDACNKEIVLYAIIDDMNVYQLDVDPNVHSEIINAYKIQVDKLFFKEEDYTILNFSTADERGHCYYRYDLEEKPEDMNLLSSVIGNRDIDKLNLAKSSVDSIKGLIVIISSGIRRVSFYKLMASVEKFIANKNILFYPVKDRFEKVKTDIIRISPSFQMFQVEEDIIITNIKTLESKLGIDQIIRNEAKKMISTLDAVNLLSNIDGLQQYCKDDKSLSKKLITAVKKSPVLYKGIETARIVEFAKEKKSKIGKLSFSADGKFEIKNKAEAKRFIELLNDDLLKSELTDEEYIAKAKDELKEVAPNNIL